MVGLDGIFNFGGKLIDRLWPDPETAAKAKLELAQMNQNGELAQMNARYGAITAEANSEDKWTSRARPSFMYVMYLTIILCFVGGILGVWWPTEVTAAAKNIKALLASIPDGMWTTFTVGYTGYSLSRSYDKKQKANAGL